MLTQSSPRTQSDIKAECPNPENSGLKLEFSLPVHVFVSITLNSFCPFFLVLSALYSYVSTKSKILYVSSLG